MERLTAVTATPCRRYMSEFGILGPSSGSPSEGPRADPAEGSIVDPHAGLLGVAVPALPRCSGQRTSEAMGEFCGNARPPAEIRYHAGHQLQLPYLPQYVPSRTGCDVEAVRSRECLMLGRIITKSERAVRSWNQIPLRRPDRN